MGTAFLDFATLKAQTKIEQIVHMLGLSGKQQGSQWRGPCTQCRSGGDRALAVNTDKQSYFCFSDKKGGDLLSLCAHITGKSQRDAAQQIATHFRFAGDNLQTPATAPQAPQKKQRFDADAYLRTLDPAADPLKELGVSPDTLKDWRAGYCKAGVNRGRLAIALCDRNILGFCGRSLISEPMTFPTGVNPRDLIFGQDKITGEEVRLLRDPLEVMQASEVGESAVCFLTENVEPMQLEMLASLLDAKKARVFF
jgi:hypothetical protein